MSGNAAQEHGLLRLSKNTGYWILGLGSIALVAAIGMVLVYGLVWVAAKLYPVVEFLSILGFVALLLNLLPSAIFKGSRRYCGKGIVIVSYIWGVALWFYSTLLLYQFWGPVGIFLGFPLLGLGTAALTCLAALFRGQWNVIGQLWLWVAMVFAVRTLGYWILSKAPELAPAALESPPDLNLGERAGAEGRLDSDWLPEEPKLILVADDEPAIADLIAGILSQNGYRALSTYDGDSAIKQARTLRPDLAIVDLEMPSKDGIETAIEILKESPWCKVLLSSSLRGWKLRQRLGIAQIQGYDFDVLPIPFSEETLLEKIREHIEQT